MSSHQSPLRYPGGKTRARKALEEIITDRVDITDFHAIVSPYFGGGSFELYMQEKHGLHILANDAFRPLSIFWKILKDSADELADCVDAERPVSKERFTQIRSAIMNESEHMQVATWYYVINRCSFSGATLSGGFSAEAATRRFTDSSVQRLRNIDLSRMNIYRKDGVEFLQFVRERMQTQSSMSGKRVLLFVDPPYYLQPGKNNLYGNRGDMHEGFDHAALAAELTNHDHWVLTYNDCEYIRELYSDYDIIEAAWSYGMNASKKSSEIVIINC